MGASRSRSVPQTVDTSAESEPGADTSSPAPPEVSTRPPIAASARWRYYAVLRTVPGSSHLVGIHFGPHRSEFDSPWGQIRTIALASGSGSCLRVGGFQEAVELFEERSPNVRIAFHYWS